MINQLVSDLPEIYQPIYGHPELSDKVSRSCVDRFAHIARIHDALQSLLGRPLKVLDLGCAQGYFSFNLAERGAQVRGVDYLDKNIAVCNALTQEHPDLQISFEVGRVEDAIAALEPGQYDLVLGLSVFHHIIHEIGDLAVKAMLEQIAAHSAALVVELALREEPLYWAAAQPKDSRSLIENIAFVHEIAHHDTHLALIPRPLFVASNRYWIIENQIAQFETWSSDPHALAKGVHRDTRRYFFSSDLVLKLYRFTHPGEYNKADFKKELCVLEAPPPGFDVPSLVAFGESDDGAWLIMKRLHGRLLLDMLREGDTIDSRAVLLAVLNQLALLEGAGLYHNDVRTWNVIVTEDGATHLIDYGSISNCPQDCVWPGNLFLSFLIFVREVVTGVVDDPDPLRTIAISPFGLPQPYRDWAKRLWCRPLVQWSFKLMYETLRDMPVEGGKESLEQPGEAWMMAMEEAVQAQKLFAQHLRQEAGASLHHFEQMFSALTESHRRELALCHSAFQRLDEQVKAAEGEAFAALTRAQESEAKQRDLQTQVDQLNGHAHHWWQQSSQLEAERNTLLHSRSWRITAPLRFGVDLILRPATTLRKVVNQVLHRTIEIGQRPLARVMSAVLRRPQLSYRINQFLMRYPPLYQQLLNVARQKRVLPGMMVHEPSRSERPPQPVETEIAHLSPRARQIYADLKTAIQKQKGQN